MGLNNSALEVYTVKETAQILKTTRQQIRKMILAEELPAVKVGREWRISEEDLVAFINSSSL